MSNVRYIVLSKGQLVVELNTREQVMAIRGTDGFIGVEYYTCTPLLGEIGSAENVRFVFTPVPAFPLSTTLKNTLSAAGGITCE